MPMGRNRLTTHDENSLDSEIYADFGKTKYHFSMNVIPPSFDQQNGGPDITLEYQYSTPHL